MQEKEILKGLYEREKIILTIEPYANGNLFIDLQLENGFSLETLTINQENTLNRNQAFIRSHEIPELIDFIRKNNLGKIIEGATYSVGNNVEIPLYEFNEDRLRKCDPLGYERYENSFPVQRKSKAL